MARKRRKQRGPVGSEPADVPGVPAPPPLIYLGGLLAGVVLELLAPTPSLPFEAALPIGIAAVLAWLWLDIGSMLIMSQAGTSPIPFKPSQALVTSGPYKLSRNPIYVGMSVLYAGLSLALGILWALAMLPLVLLAIDRLVIRREEPYLEARFGDAYREYASRVRRWL